MGLILLGRCQDTQTISHRAPDRALERDHTDKHKAVFLRLGFLLRDTATCLAAVGDTDMSSTLRGGARLPMPDTLGTLLLARITTPMLDIELDKLYLEKQSVSLTICRFLILLIGGFDPAACSYHCTSSTAAAGSEFCSSTVLCLYHQWV